MIGESSTVLSSLQYEASIPQEWGADGLKKLFHFIEEYHTQCGVTGFVAPHTCLCLDPRSHLVMPCLRFGDL